jgi:hypothetical protein
MRGPEQEEDEMAGLTDRYAPDEWAALARIYGTNPAAAPPDPDLVALVAVSSSLGLDPFAGLLYLLNAKEEVWSDEAGMTVARWRKKPAIRRDGLVAIAESRPEYRGMQFGVVHADDSIDVTYEGDPLTDPKVEHGFSLGKPRGAVLGAWAKCYVEGRGPVFYYASMEEHGRWRDVLDRDPTTGEATPRIDPASGRPVRELDDAWGYLSASILAAAQSYVLRLGLGVTGVVPADEMRHEREGAKSTDGSGESGAAAGRAVDLFPWDTIEPPEVRDRLRSAFEEMQAADPTRWPVARFSLYVGGKDGEALHKFATQLEDEAAEARFMGEAAGDAAS